MTPVLWLLALLSLIVAGSLGFFAGRAAGSRTADAARSQDRLDSERRLGEERAALAIATEKSASAHKDRDARLEEVTALRRDIEQARLRFTDVSAASAGLRMQVDSLETQLRTALDTQQRVAVNAEESLEQLRDQLGRSEQARSRLETELASERALGAERLETMRKAEDERKELFAGARVDMANSFEKVAAGILEDKSKRFTEQNRANLDQVLLPLRERLGEFQLKVEGLQSDGLVGRTELKAQIEALRGMNEKLSTDANNLVKALKGSSKQQGDWGELILLDMLKEAGLQEGQQFRVQASFANEEGRQVRPDVILNLPGDKHLVIDSKVSLTSYTEYCACDDDQSRIGFLERHAKSLQNHIDGLSLKRYQALHQLQSLDFVVMFIPIEPAYLLALAHDGGLWQRAWNKNVLLVSPGTLFPVIRTIAHIWQQERQTRNVEDILRHAGGLYDKVATFADSFEEVGKRLDLARSSYDKAFGQLATGNGHVLSRISKLKALGLKTSKKMPSMFQAADGDDADEQALVQSSSNGSPSLPLLEE